MSQEYISSNFINTDLNVACYGHQKCPSKHSFGPFIRDYYLIHCILSGSGTFCVHGKSYTLKKGDCFLIRPGIITYYEASSNNPWEYIWLGFNGTKALQYIDNVFSSPVLNFKEYALLEDCILDMLNYTSITIGKDLILQSYLYKFIYILTTKSNYKTAFLKEFDSKKYVEFATTYINSNYGSNISVLNIASYVNISRVYLFKLFKTYLGISPQKFLIQVRMERAAILLKTTNHSIGNIARSVGYRDVLLFSKTFKRVNGITASEYRKDTVEQ